MMRFWSSITSSVAALTLASSVAYAADPLAADKFSGYELRVAGLMHDLEPGSSERGSGDLGASIVFPKVDAGFSGVSNLFIPRAHIGATANFVGKTSFAYAGVTWSVPVTTASYFSVDFGGALNNGDLDGAPDRAGMGCHATFREAAALGHDLTDRVSLAATIEHFSNANLCDHNSGITNVGLMLGYKF